MHVFLGITGASGAPYAARLLEALAAADCDLGVAASSAGIEVLATELYGNARLSRDETIARLLEHAPNATVYDPNDSETVDHLVDFVVGRALDQLGLEHTLTKRWGQ
jgi:3-polyprenyl-4-hydroxybenzoate decarboxylase